MAITTAEITDNLINTLDNICELYEKQADPLAIGIAIEQARTLLNSIPEETSYIDTVLTDIQKCSIL